MKNSRLLIVLTVLLSVLMCMPVFADTEKSYCVDSTGRFSAEDIAAYNAKAEEIIEAFDIAPYFVVINDTEGKTEIQYTEDFYEENASGTNCLIMLLTEDKYYILPIGTAVDIFEYAEESLYDAFYNKLYAGEEYPAGALAYLDEVENFITDYNNSQALADNETDNKAGIRVVDNAEAIEDVAEKTVSESLDEMSNKYQCDVVLVCIPSTYGTGVTSFADNYYDFNNYGYGTGHDGIMLLISIDENERAFSVNGNAANIFNADVLSYMEKELSSYFRKKNFEDAAAEFSSLCERFLSDAEKGIIYDKETLPKSTVGPSVIIPVVVAIIAVGVVMINKKSIRQRKKTN